MQRLMMAGLVALALLATACGGSSDAETSATTPSGSTADDDRQALELIAKLGSDDAAADALIIAMDRGYSGPQILDGIDDGDLRGDGTIDGQEPANSALHLVLYDFGGEGEGALGLGDVGLGDVGLGDVGAGGTNVMLVSFLQAERIPIERLRAHATGELGVGEPATTTIIKLLKDGFLPADIIEMLILGIDGIGDVPNDRNGRDLCYRIVDELYCPDGERFQVPTEPDTSASDAAAATPEPEPDPVEDQPMQLLWEGEMTPHPDFVRDPIAGSYELTRTTGTDEFHIILTTTDAKSNTASTDGFDSVECTSEWTSSYEGTGTFWDVNDLGIEFDGQITRSTVFTSGPCEAGPSDTSDFSGVVVFITPDGIESSFNAWSFAVAGPALVPVGN